MEEAKECFIIGGGPSVTEEQIMGIKKWQYKTGGKVWAVNKVFLECPFADYVFSRDTRFLKAYERYLQHIPETMQLVVGNGTYTPPEAIRIDTQTYISGTACIEAAAHLGFRVIYLVGADGHHNGGSHWHGGYHGIKECSNADNYADFNGYYKQAMKRVKRMASVYNCSPSTAIRSVPLKDFEEVIHA